MRSAFAYLLRLLASPAVALGFLTVVPLPLPAALSVGPMGPALACFPLAGAIIGVVVGAVGWSLAPYLPAGVVASLMLAMLLGITGALHLDGFMDSFDGLFGGKDPESRRSIMKDSRVGSFGIAAAGGLLLLEYSCLSAIPVTRLIPALALAVAMARWAMVLVLWAFPPAAAKGLGAGLKSEAGGRTVIVGCLFALAVSLVAGGWIGAALFAAASLLALGVGRVATARIGGITGDICGGAGQMVEAAVLLGVVAAAPWMWR